MSAPRRFFAAFVGAFIAFALAIGASFPRPSWVRADDAAQSAVSPTTIPATGETDATAGEFLRFVDNGKAGGKLETAIVTYRNNNGVTVHLVAAIHIGEKGYFQSLNKIFTGYDAVLYELVSPKGSGVPVPGQRSDHPIAQLQRFMQETLNLSYQLDVIDYSKPNFIHADMDKDTFEKMQAARGESLESMMLQQMMQAFSQPPPDANDNGGAANNASGDSVKDMLQFLTQPDGERHVKLLLARQMGDMENSAAGFGGSVLVTERNKVAIKTLRQEIAAGKKDLAIFYGAAHMPDLAYQLDLLGFHKVSTRWLTAWDLTIRPDVPSALEQLINAAAKSLEQNDNGQ